MKKAYEASLEHPHYLYSRIRKGKLKIKLEIDSTIS
jgi:hypothetical protein